MVWLDKAVGSAVVLDNPRVASNIQYDYQHTHHPRYPTFQRSTRTQALNSNSSHGPQSTPTLYMYSMRLWPGSRSRHRHCTTGFKLWLFSFSYHSVSKSVPVDNDTSDETNISAPASSCQTKPLANRSPPKRVDETIAFFLPEWMQSRWK